MVDHVEENLLLQKTDVLQGRKDLGLTPSFFSNRLPAGVLAATLGRLMSDRALQLPDGVRLLHHEHYDQLQASGACTTMHDS